jgi:hypothetical protein
MPLCKIVHSFDQDAVALWNANFEEGLRIGKATGAQEVWSSRGNMPTIHLMGGASWAARRAIQSPTATVRPTSLSFKVVPLETAGQEVLARAGNVLVARAAFGMCISLYQGAEIELRQASRVIRSTRHGIE